VFLKRETQFFGVCLGLKTGFLRLKVSKTI
jgi:hypothetical protein